MRKLLLAALLGVLAGGSGEVHGQAAPVDGQFAPPKAPADLKWESLFSGKLEGQWTGMSMAINSPFLVTAPDPERPGDYILHIERTRTGLIRSLKAYENFILEFEWRHLTESPKAGGSPTTSGNSGVIIGHGALPKAGSPYPGEGHEIQVCNLGNGSWYTSHGDTFTMPGSTSEGIPDPRFAVSHVCGHRSMPLEFHGSKTGEWNKIRVTCVDGVIQHEVNGYLATSLYRASPRKGYLSLESEGAPVEFRQMRIHELAPDPELSVKHVAPLLPQPMTAEYISERTPLELPGGDSIVVVDVQAKLPLASLLSGVGLPDTAVAGRVVASFSVGNLTVTVDGKPMVENAMLSSDTKAVLHLADGKFGHVLLLKPVKPAN